MTGPGFPGVQANKDAWPVGASVDACAFDAIAELDGFNAKAGPGNAPGVASWRRRGWARQGVGDLRIRMEGADFLNL